MNVGRHWSAEFVAITAAVRALPFRRIMLDGEAVTHCLEGLPDFHRPHVAGRPVNGGPGGNPAFSTRVVPSSAARASAWVGFR